MKANEAPEKLHLLPNGLISYCRTNEDDIEYVRKDSFIEKAKEFIWSHTEGSDYHVNYVLKEFENFMGG